ncbi:MAG: family 1 encapsulin nanocompartment shell protein [Acidobacteriota bacterium]
MRFLHSRDPLTPQEWEMMNKAVRRIGNSSVSRRFIESTEEVGAGTQTAPTKALIGITEGRKGLMGDDRSAVTAMMNSAGIIPILHKDFILHWRDIEQTRATHQGIPLAKAAAAAAICARAEERFVLFGDEALGYEGLMNAGGRCVLTDIRWDRRGDAFDNFRKATRMLMSKGHTGPYAALVTPKTYANMHRIIDDSSLPEIAYVKELVTGGVFASPMMKHLSGLVVSVGRQNVELVVAVDTAAAFLGSKQMNPHFRVFKAVYLRILRSDAICTF